MLCYASSLRHHCEVGDEAEAKGHQAAATCSHTSLGVETPAGPWVCDAGLSFSVFGDGFCRGGPFFRFL